ncbi:MAG: EamA family transporter [Gammaproteobacteria bacterium]|nr:EamA family transporter [Gammaproteobacteria bacterium]
MRNAILYLVTVLVWGSTWLAIEFQLGDVPVTISVVYRFAIAGMIMWAYCCLARVPMHFTLRQHGYIILLACGNFSLNYVVIYWAQLHINSALTSVAFSTMLLMNIINTRLFFGTPIAPRVYIGAVVGISGIVALFWQGLSSSHSGDNIPLGLALVLISGVIASLGNMVSVRNSRDGMNVFSVNAWGMLYGTLILYVIAKLAGDPFVFSDKPAYLYSLLYLAVFGTVVAFATYFLLLRDIGPEKASYVIVLFPVVALTLSSLFEEFVWSTNILLGFALVLAGNAIVLTPGAKLSAAVARFRA